MSRRYDRSGLLCKHKRSHIHEYKVRKKKVGQDECKVASSNGVPHIVVAKLISATSGRVLPILHYSSAAGDLKRPTWRMTAICAARRPTTCSFASIKRKRSPAVLTPCQTSQTQSLDKNTLKVQSCSCKRARSSSLVDMAGSAAPPTSHANTGPRTEGHCQTSSDYDASWKASQASLNKCALLFSKVNCTLTVFKRVSCQAMTARVLVVDFLL